jgi:hypothetical protein
MGIALAAIAGVLGALVQAVLLVGGCCLALIIVWKLLSWILRTDWLAVPAIIAGAFLADAGGCPGWLISVMMTAMFLGSQILQADLREPMDIKARQRAYRAMTQS